MTAVELSLCLGAVVTSSVSQLCIKTASRQPRTARGLLFLGASGLFMLSSILVVIWVLRTIQLSELLPFAAAAYILVPLGGAMLFNEQLRPRFWLGVASIMVGIFLTRT